MPWQAPTFDITGKNYTVDPRPVQEVIQQGANIQKDTLKNLAGVVQGGIDVAQGMMARRQLSELKSQISGLDPLAPDYAETRANLLANNMSAFTDPRTKGVASEILSGFDKVRDNENARQKAAITAANYMDRLGASNNNRLGQMAVGHEYRSAEAAQRAASRADGAADNIDESVDDITDEYNNLVNPGGGAKPAAKPAAAGQPQERVPTNQQIEPDLPTGGGSPDDVLLRPGDPMPPAAAKPAAPAAPAPVNGPGKYLPEEEDGEEGGLGPAGPPGAAGAAAPPPAAPAEGAPSAQEAEQVTNAQNPGLAKTALLEKTIKTIAGFNKSTDPARRTRAAQIKTALEADPDVIEHRAQKTAAYDIRLAALKEAAEHAKGLKETNETIKDRVETAVKFDMAREDAALSFAAKKADELRKQYQVKGADTATLGPQLEKADLDAAKMAAEVNQKRALVEAQWREKIRENPNAFLEDMRAAEKKAKEEKIAKNWDDFIEKQDDPGMEGSRVTDPNGYTPTPKTEDEKAVEASRAAAFAPQSKGTTDANAQWTAAKAKFDEHVGKKAMYDAVAGAVGDDGKVDETKLTGLLMNAFKGNGTIDDSISASAGQVPRSWDKRNLVTYRELAEIRAKELIQERNLAIGRAGSDATSDIPGVTYRTTKKS